VLVRRLRELALPQGQCAAVLSVPHGFASHAGAFGVFNSEAETGLPFSTSRGQALHSKVVVRFSSPTKGVRRSAFSAP
jgi:hypothetical protein